MPRRSNAAPRVANAYLADAVVESNAVRRLKRAQRSMSARSVRCWSCSRKSAGGLTTNSYAVGLTSALPAFKTGGAYRASPVGPEPFDIAQFTGHSPISKLSTK